MVDPQKAVGLVQTVWRHRFLLRLNSVSKEEKRLYRRLLEMNQRCWDDFLEIRRTNPGSLVFISPFTVKARPLVGQPVTDDQRKELDAQDRLWSYLDCLGKALRAFKWSAPVVANFKLLSYRQKCEIVGSDWMNEFEEHQQRLAAMANQSVLSGLQRKLTVIEGRTEVVFDLPPEIPATWGEPPKPRIRS